ncbi:SusC/RagA family TonB-linked outer membrane protein [Pedobacter heparinus]|uniref:TonB-dependent receptor plug n=2 Tax=Pedobacter TaxID=84567 RepID=C6XY27_PEDHD|nr:TonB-dependent receptor [Pedobacter heparinus]ACU04445.1 TonB-dependent receptor plug [Pedobacter heparinus DSM 2366]
MKTYIYWLSFSWLLLSCCFAHAQNRIVEGLVKDNTGALPGASITEKGVAANGTSTDGNGRFRLTLKGSGNILLISSVGYLPQELNLNGKSNVVVTLVADAKGLSEVVVVGYGTQKKLTVTGSVSSVKGSELRQNPSASLQNTLSGRLPGFFSQQRSGIPGSDGAAFYIRGVSTFSNGAGANQPLIIVDDVESTYDQVARIDANEIESISILKDASTTAVYGIKGANGVMVITTRRGQAGPAKISLRTETGFQQPTKVPEYLNSYRTALLRNEALANDGLAAEFSAADLEHFRLGDDPYGHPDINWYETLFKDFSTQWRNNLDISGGTENTRYFVSLGSLWQNGMLRNFGEASDVNNDYSYKRYNFRSNLDVNLTKTLSLRFDLSGNIGRTNTPNVPGPFSRNDVFFEVSNYQFLPPYVYPIYNPDGSYGFSNRVRDRINNVVGRLSLDGYQRNFENNLNFVANAVQKLDVLTKGLSVKANLSYASSQSSSRNLTRDLFPSFIYNPADDSYTPRDESVFRVQKYRLQYGTGNMLRRLNTQLMLNYDRSFDQHHLYGLALFNQMTDIAPNTDTQYDYVPSNSRGFTARLGYDYKSRYLLEFNMAYNGTDRFVGNKRYGLFPAVSAGWNVASEPFMKGLKAVQLLKLRGSYGMVGSDVVSGGKYLYKQSYDRGGTTSFGYSHNAYSGIVEGTLGNADVSWEKERKANIGIDLLMWGGKLGATIDYFDNYRYDILTPRNGVSSIFGQALPVMNVGEVSNKGYEVELTHNNRINDKLNYTIRGNISVARNKILYQDEAEPAFPWLRQTGHSIGSIAVYTFNGFYRDAADVQANPAPNGIVPKPGDMKYKDLNGDGLIDSYDKSYVGYPNLPDTNYGLSLGLNYGAFSLNVLFQGAANFNIRGTAAAIDAFQSNLQPLHEKRWTPETAETAAYPRLSSIIGGLNSSTDYPSTYWLVPGDYLRLRSAELSYSLPQGMVKRLRMQSARIYTNGYNLITWSKIDKRYQLDPEASSGGDKYPYPPQRIYNIGLMLSF